jgi:hypothetical protein
MKILGIYYICTGRYKLWFDGFLKSLAYLLPGDEKHIVIISDGLNEYSNYIDNENLIFVDKVDCIKDYPWPIVTLFKMKYIYDNQNPLYDYCFYFNGNAEVLNKPSSFWNHFRVLLQDNDMIVAYHATDAMIEKTSLYKRGSRHINLKRSSSYIDTDLYIYVHAAFFCGKSQEIYRMCKTHVDMVSVDLLNRIIAPWDDESYFNKYVYEHRKEMNILYMMVLYAEEIGYLSKYESDLFVKLRHNDSNKTIKRRFTKEIPLFLKFCYYVKTKIDRINNKEICLK